MVPYSWLHGLAVEVESGRVMLELGPLGFLLVYFVRLYLAFFAFRQALRLRTRFHRALATASFLFFLAGSPGGVVFDVTSDLYYWFFGGLLLLARCGSTARPRRQAARPDTPPRPALPAAG